MASKSFHNVQSGAPVKLKKITYTGHASPIYSVDQAIEILDYIGSKTNSDDVLPFAIRLVEGGNLIQIAEDNGEVCCGRLLLKSLEKLDGYNVMVCVSRHVAGCYISEMVQAQKLIAVEEAAEKAISNLHDHLKPESDRTSIDESRSEGMFPPIKSMRPVLEPKKNDLVASFSLGEEAMRRLSKTRGKLAKFQTRLLKHKI
jgi:hypothetical protein